MARLFPPSFEDGEANTNTWKKHIYPFNREIENIKSYFIFYFFLIYI